MKTIEALTTAASHFLQNYKGGTQTIELFDKYATEELELAKEEAKDFAIKIENRQTVEQLDKNDDMERFFLWYYINYVALTDVYRN